MRWFADRYHSKVISLGATCDESLIKALVPRLCTKLPFSAFNPNTIEKIQLKYDHLEVYLMNTPIFEEAKKERSLAKIRCEAMRCFDLEPFISQQ